ncbi:unnamed protein product [Cyclocybe aegerita]|uniref:Uncharacterized protein n=1 Tax=Cyclocybe aegerita TaxID=1973307 RepID=A0A8S0WT45_CYCAE|nr:unnamed protein product [Cyclocybe aegerita]
MFPTFAIPFIHGFSLKIQVSILLTLLLASYLNKTARFVIAALATGYLAFKILVPVVQVVIYVFKGVAMFGFYMHYFRIAVGMIGGGIVFVWNYVSELVEEAKRQEEEEER